MQAFFFLLVFNLFSVIMFAQDNTGAGESTTTSKTATTKTTDINISTDGAGEWYTQPWVWIVGGIILLLIIIALVSRNRSVDAGRTDKVTYTKTTSTDSNT